jgi:hypothetical protein
MQNYKIIATMLGSTAILLFVGSCTTKNGASLGNSAFDNLQLVAKYEPLHIGVYVDTKSTNKHPDFTITLGGGQIYSRETASNEVEIIHFEKGNEILVTDYDPTGHILRRNVNFYDGGAPTYTYVDTNGDGLFDFLISGYKFPNVAVYARSNLCWVPFSKSTTIPRP